MDIVTWVVLGVFCMLAGLWLWCGVGQRRGRRLDDGTLVKRVGLTAQPVLSREELEWYNLIRLAVQDRYLVLSQVPLWVLVTMRGGNRSERATLMGRLALKRVGFVLLHPGTGDLMLQFQSSPALPDGCNGPRRHAARRSPARGTTGSRKARTLSSTTAAAHPVADDSPLPVRAAPPARRSSSQTTRGSVKLTYRSRPWISTTSSRFPRRK